MLFLFIFGAGVRKAVANNDWLCEYHVGDSWLLGSLGQEMFISTAAEKEGGLYLLGSQHREDKSLSDT